MHPTLLVLTIFQEKNRNLDFFLNIQSSSFKKWDNWNTFKRLSRQNEIYLQAWKVPSQNANVPGSSNRFPFSLVSIGAFSSFYNPGKSSSVFIIPSLNLHLIWASILSTNVFKHFMLTASNPHHPPYSVLFCNLVSAFTFLLKLLSLVWGH